MSIHELQAALRALDEARAYAASMRGKITTCDKPMLAAKVVHAAEQAVLDTARRVAEGAGEPVAWGVFVDGEVKRTILRSPRAGEVFYSITETTRPLYTTPPSADALVEALVDAVCALEVCGKDYPAMEKARRVLAQHKENTDVR